MGLPLGGYGAHSRLREEDPSRTSGRVVRGGFPEQAKPRLHSVGVCQPERRGQGCPGSGSTGRKTARPGHSVGRARRVWCVGREG